MTSLTSTDQHKHASWQMLAAVFMIALLLFIALRWQPEAWIEAQISKQSKQHAVTIHYDSLQLDGFTLLVNQLSIQSSRLNAPIKLDSLNLSPAWSILLSGTLGANIQLNWQGQTFSAIIIKQADSIDIQSLHGDLDVALLQPLLAKNIPIPIKASGRILINGDISFNAINGHPLQGKVNFNWNRAAVKMPSMNIALGDYALNLQNDDPKKLWQWDLHGGSALQLTGKGMLNTSAKKPAIWPVSGLLQIQADAKASNLAALLGKQSKRFSISGNITQPRLQPL